MISPADELEYRVTPMVAEGDSFKAAPPGPTDLTAPTLPVGEDASELSTYFN
jgi:hypothetical protein